jgi:Ca2+-dependent lipid-binding protein
MSGRRLKATVWECRNLENKDWGGKNDPFVTLVVGDEEHKTPAVDDGGAAPKWPGGSSHVFEGSEGLERLVITVLDEDVTTDENIGAHTFDLANFISGGEDAHMEEWLSLTGDGKQNGDETGEILLQLVWEEPPEISEGEPPVVAEKISDNYPQAFEHSNEPVRDGATF